LSPSPYRSREGDLAAARQFDESNDRERLIPFPGADGAQRRRQTSERNGRPRRARRRRTGSPWLQRNALSIAALSFLVALLGVGFGVVQLLNRPEPTPALLSVSAPEQATTLSVASVGTPASVALNSSISVAPLGTTASPANRSIQATARVIEANYTVEAGDTLARIAARYNTTVERIQAFNANLTDPRTLRIGARLVVPPPL
jgi:hypothetical protein